MVLQPIPNNAIVVSGLVTDKLDQFEYLLRSVAGHAYVIVCTEDYCLQHLDIFYDFPHSLVYILTANNSGGIEQALLPHQFLYQWYKFKKCLELASSIERKYSIRLNRIFKLRTDYNYTDISSLADEIKNKGTLPGDVIYTESDRVFFGSRDTIFSLRHVLDFSLTLLVGKPDFCYPISFSHLIKSDLQCIRWERCNFDRRIFNYKTLSSLLSISKTEIQHFADMQTYDEMSPPSFSDIYSFHTGNRVFPGERSFAWYLNVHAIVAKSHPTMSGFVIR